jgi:D-arginine dehydrogenase
VSDFLIVGAGIAGASAGYFLAAHGRVTLLEMESALGYHATGRSAAVFSEYYGGPQVRALTAASRPFLERPPPGFAEHRLLTPRGVLALCPAGGEDRFELALRDGLLCPIPAVEIDVAEVAEHCPVIRPGWATRAMRKPGVADVDVDALHQGFLRGIRAHGGEIVPRAKVTGLEVQGGQWHTSTGHSAPILVNAAGAWADRVAALAGAGQCALVPRRRTALLTDGPLGVDTAGWPMVCDVTDAFYFKPESGRLLISPADATDAAPGDARPEDLDVALGIERVQEATTLEIRHVRRAWAGLRTSAADDLPVVGADLWSPGFYWLAGLGGYGVQLSPAVGELLARIVLGIGPELAELSPARFASSQARQR